MNLSNCKTIEQAPGKIDIIVDFIKENFAEPGLNVNHICQSLKISRSRVYELITEKYGIKPSEFILRLRLERALLNMLDNDIEIRAVAASVGFRNVRTFQNVFKKMLKLSPIQCKKKIHNSAEPCWTIFKFQRQLLDKTKKLI